MSIATYIEKMCVQTLVYWAAPTDDGYGGFTFSAPVELKCRWQEKAQLLGKADETVIISRAIIYVLQDVDLDELMWLGELTDLTPTQLAEPRSIPDMTIIKRFEKSPAIKSNVEFLRKVTVSPFMY